MSDAFDLTLGIDLGNSFSTAAVRFNDRTYYVCDNRGEPCIPSVVYYPSEGSPVVGNYAVRMRTHEPGNTVSGIKRVLGRKFASPEVRVFRAHSAVRVRRATNDLPVLEARGQDHTPVDVASAIFKHLRDLAEARFQRSIRKAVISIPASATLDIEHATVQAARAAGLHVVRTVTEPQAATYACDHFAGYQPFVVFDFGGGTFDVTVIEQAGDRLKPIAIGGDGCLGGDDLDHALAELAAAHLWRATKILLCHDLERWERLIRTAEQTKRGLSARHVAPLSLKNAYAFNGGHRDLDLLIHRSDAESQWVPIVERALSVTAQTMLAAGLKPRDVGSTLLVGGTTFVPMVQHAVRKLMGGLVTSHPHPQTAVAEGAAIAAHRTPQRAARAA